MIILMIGNDNDGLRYIYHYIVNLLIVILAPLSKEKSKDNNGENTRWNAAGCLLIWSVGTVDVLTLSISLLLLRLSLLLSHWLSNFLMRSQCLSMIA